MRAVILSAGQGSRLLPLTADRPKCLLPVDERTLLECQVDSLLQCGVDEIAVVVGFKARLVEDLLQRLRRPRLAIRTVFNPFYNVADNLGSCWLARPEMGRNFLLVNGDTLFEPAVLRRLLDKAPAPITVTIDRKDSYDADDMKVRVEGTRLLEIGKTLPLDVVNGESIGLLRFLGTGPHIFAEAVDRAMRQPEGLTWWYLKVIGQLAQTHEIETVSIEGLGWGEVDFPQDLLRAQRLVQDWTARRALPLLRRAP